MGDISLNNHSFLIKELKHSTQISVLCHCQCQFQLPQIISGGDVSRSVDPKAGSFFHVFGARIFISLQRILFHPLTIVYFVNLFTTLNNPLNPLGISTSS